MAQIPGHFLQFFSGAENGNTVCFYGNNFSGFGIAGLFSSLACSNFESAETPQLHNPIAVQGVFDFIKESINNHMDIFSADSGFFIDMFYDLGLSHLVFFNIGHRNPPSHKIANRSVTILRQGRKPLVHAGFLAGRGIRMIKSFSGRRINKLYELHKRRFGNSLIFFFNGRFEGLNTGPYAAADSPVVSPPLYTLSVPLSGII